MEETNLIPFNGDKIRRIWHDNQWYFSVVDLVEILTESVNPSNYWNMLKKREPQLYTICVKLKFLAVPKQLCESTK